MEEIEDNNKDNLKMFASVKIKRKKTNKKIIFVNRY